MTDFNEKDRKLVDCLLQDFNSIKSEISRRSTLQRIVLLSYILLIAYAFQLLIMDSNHNLLTIFGIWLGSLLAILYYVREKHEINRLGLIIKSEIAKIVANKLDVNDNAVFHSETNKLESEDIVVAHYYKLFIWLLLWVIPLFISLLWISSHMNFISELGENNCIGIIKELILIFLCIATSAYVFYILIVEFRSN